MSKHLYPHKILWLASYPKSGNTWFRAFLTALMNNGKVDINQLKSDGIFSSRETFELTADIDSRDLYDIEVKIMLPEVYRQLAAENKALSILKAHDAFGSNAEGKELIPVDVTQCAIYFIRNPLDIVGSLANHMQYSIQQAVDMLNNKNAFIAEQAGNFNKSAQLPQYLSDWSSHVHSWTQLPKFPVHVMRYEDMLTNTFECFNKALKFIGWQASPIEITKAIQVTSFDQLSKQENEKGFEETLQKNATFFRSGTMNNWKKELTEVQITQIVSLHKEVMKTYQYQ